METKFQESMRHFMNYMGWCFFLLSLFLVFFNKKLIFCWKMLKMNSMSMDILFLVDWMSMTFFMTLCIMVSCVLKFSTVYMSKEVYFQRFHYMVLSFVFSMFCLIFMPHFFFLLVGWDGLGITSFLLVIYYLSKSSWAAGMKTYLMNRMGDSFFMISLGLFFMNGHWDMTGLNKDISPFMVILIMLGCFTKSAQFPFSSWLPAAMAAPTPVSSLVHSSTLVTAGVYLLMRFSYMMPSYLFMVIGLLGLWTLYSASLAACFEWDAKKMVAYSTLSQLGFMVVAMSLGFKYYAFFHLMTHAMFKAVMFMCVGYLMVKKGHFQDLRSLSGMWKCSPMMSFCLVMSALSLSGLPFMGGFYSKELMIESSLFSVNEMYFHLLLLSLPLTSFYISRLVFSLFTGQGYNVFSRVKDSNMMLSSVLPLFLGSMVVGKVLNDQFFSTNFLYPCSLFKALVNILMVSGMILAYWDCSKKSSTFSWFSSEMSFMSPFKGKYWVDMGSNVGEDMYNLVDQGKFSKSLTKIDLSFLTTGSLVKKFYEFFLTPKMNVYISIIILISLMTWFFI